MIVTIDGISGGVLSSIKSRFEDDIDSVEEYKDADDTTTYTVKFKRGRIFVETRTDEVFIHNKNESKYLSRFDYSQIILY